MDDHQTASTEPETPEPPKIEKPAETPPDTRKLWEKPTMRKLAANYAETGANTGPDGGTVS